MPWRRPVGGNHFVEVQKVEKILDGTVAHAWGLTVGQVVVMVHTGSVGFGHLCGYLGEPVLVPGSMGASSFLLVGQGNAESLASASHGAGRSLARGEAMHGHEAEFDDFLKRFRVVTPVDFRRADLQARRDILKKKLDELKQEAPYAYKGIGPIVRTLREAGIARPVAELQPIMTVKG